MIQYQAKCMICLSTPRRWGGFGLSLNQNFDDELRNWSQEHLRRCVIDEGIKFSANQTLYSVTTSMLNQTRHSEESIHPDNTQPFVYQCDWSCAGNSGLIMLDLFESCIHCLLIATKWSSTIQRSCSWRTFLLFLYFYS